MLRIAITGPESSGKTSLARLLARHFNTGFVAAPALPAHSGNHPCKQEDLDHIAREQGDRIRNSIHRPLIADTEMVSIYAWSIGLFGSASPFILRQLSEQQFDLYILCDMDFQARSDQNKQSRIIREDHFHLYYKKLREMQQNFILVRGTPEERYKQALSAIDGVINKTKLL